MLRRAALPIAALVVAAFLFGATFVVIKDAIELLPPLAFVGWRFLIGALVLLALARPLGRVIWKDGFVAGVFLFAGYALQTEGLARTSASNSGLITGLYVVVTPLLAAAVARRRPQIRIIAGTILAFAGLALVTIGDRLVLATGDLLTVGCAVAFAGHIVVLARVAPRHPVIPLTAIQLLVTAVLSLAGSALREGFPLPGRDVMVALVFTGVVVSGGAFLAQVWAQSKVGASLTAIILALEPAFAVATAAVVAGEVLTDRGWIGAGLILVGIVVVVSLSEEELPAAEAVSPAH